MGRPCLSRFATSHKRHKLAAAIILGLLPLLLMEFLPAGPPCHQLASYSRQVLAADGSLLRLTLAADGQYRLWTPLAQIAPSMQQAILLKEDRHFFAHPGCDPLALLRSMINTYLRGHRQGGSTLTMQLARRIYGIHSRTILGKGKQIIAALWLEARYRKTDLLEAYLNLAPMGGNIEGVGAAARIYFAKSPAELSVAESLALAVLPQNPNKRSQFGPHQQQARQQLAQAWHARFASTDIPLLTTMPLPGNQRKHLPFIAPHLTSQLLRQTGSEQIQSFLEPTIQALMEQVLQDYIREHRLIGIDNAACLLVDSRSMAVQALVGSADFWDASIQGQVNGVMASRSPGSTLKPLLYALAIDQGLIHPRSILNDLPTTFAGYQPENFDAGFTGPITAQEALVRSRNIPAVSLANRLGHPTVYDLLAKAGIKDLQPAKHYGLALVLGGGELSMVELVGLYGAFANAGQWQPVRFTPADHPVPCQAFFSPEAAFCVRTMLTIPPSGEYAGIKTPSWPIAWKTGTSWGYRDAWTVGLAGPYILAVWVGHFNGQGNPAFVGGKAAAPLFFRLTRALELTGPQQQSPPETIPAGLRRIAVCTASGELPNRWCPQTSPTWFIPGTSPIAVSTLHQAVQIDRTTGLRACGPWDPQRMRREVFEFWPSDMAALFAQAGIPRKQPPPPEPGCMIGNSVDAGLANHQPPRISYPQQHITYTLRLSNPQETLQLQANLYGQAQRLYWFADDRYLGSSTRHQVLHWRPPHPGRYALLVIDDMGKADSYPIRVHFMP